MKTKGFTLAEILITLTVIGIVSSMTIPTLLNNTQDQQLKTAWKKTFGDINQATNRLVGDNGGSLKGAFTNEQDAGNKFLQYLGYIKKCTNSANENCWHQPNVIKFLNGNVSSFTYTAPGAILNNGALMVIMLDSPSCIAATDSPPRWGWIAVDVNGFKSPNTYGKDIFAMYYMQNAVKPRGLPDDTYTDADCSSSGIGMGCSALYLYQ